MKKVLFLFLFMVGFLPAAVATAGPDDRFSGWAWSPNIGWISYNCTNTNYCGVVDYGVTIGADNSTVSGWAWSPNIGWIDMSGTTYTAFSGTLTGIATAVAGTVDVDGWDGGISISDTSPVAYGPVVGLTGEVGGYSWGEPVIGWISYNCSNQSTCGTVDYKVSIDPFYFDFTADVGLVPTSPMSYDGNVTLSWTTVDAVSCTASNGAGTTWTNTATKAVNDSEVINNMTADTLFSLTCEDLLGRTITRDLTVYVASPPPSLTFTAASYNVPLNSPTTLTWNTQNVTGCVKHLEHGLAQKLRLAQRVQALLMLLVVHLY